MEEVAPARLSPWFGHEGAGLQGSKVEVGGEMIQDLVEDILWDSENGDHLGFIRGGTLRL